ncbi:hypothetical protein ACFL1H_00995 [Nanoarchaeota archaeon]
MNRYDGKKLLVGKTSHLSENDYQILCDNTKPLKKYGLEVHFKALSEEEEVNGIDLKTLEGFHAIALDATNGGGPTVEGIRDSKMNIGVIGLLPNVSEYATFQQKFISYSRGVNRLLINVRDADKFIREVDLVLRRYS